MQMKLKILYLGAIMVALSSVILYNHYYLAVNIGSGIYDVNYDDYAVVVGTASWAHCYSDIKELTETADLVVQGTVTSSVSYIWRLPYDAPGNWEIFTNYTFAVERILKGEIKQEEIIIDQTGGKIGRNIRYIDDDPLLPEGAKMILFLREYAPNNCCILGGPQGRFHVLKNKVYSIGEIYPDAAMSTERLYTGGKKLKQFYQEVQSYQ